ncbi:MAG TPA: PSD1 and planctomycete cytochrome C domain-containing protein, partial [Armatimonadota bacterium]|nr:PSD1 and planctomycete cytochrome C domain-containing protein [Armatimonadota bacterium]
MRAAGLVLIAVAALAAATVAFAQSGEGNLAPSAAALLQQRCLSCHGEERKGGLDLRMREGALKGGGRGAAVVPGKGAESLLYRAVSGTARPSMPPGQPLSPDEQALLKRWIDAGAPWPAAGESHWAFRKAVHPPVPHVRQQAWVRNPIDAFVLDALEKKGLTPSPAADRSTLLRRLTLDLTGLPATLEEIDRFQRDRSPDAYEKVVKRLLASPQYGERWAQHWLDVVRFAETNGFELDAERPQAWRYRDWVVRALNTDLPYDRFLMEQVAGDELAPDDFDARVATGFLRAGPQHVVGGNQDTAVNRQEWLTEAVSSVGNAVLGLTIGCARCHDHKFDPIPQADYYRLQAFFAAADNFDYEKNSSQAEAAYKQAAAEHQKRLEPLQQRIAAIEQPYRQRLVAEKAKKLDPVYAEALRLSAAERTPEQKRLAGEAQTMLKVEWDELVASLSPLDRLRRADLRRELHALEQQAPEPLPMAPGVADTMASAVPGSHLLLRGDPHTPGPEVQPALPAVLADRPSVPITPPRGVKSTGRRSALAQWLVSPENPLTARVLVNRLWQHHFGRGIVGTPNDFGKNGQAPTHPELLDWLATEFIAPAGASDRYGCGWSLKRLHWLMVT